MRTSKSLIMETIYDDTRKRAWSRKDLPVWNMHLNEVGEDVLYFLIDTVLDELNEEIEDSS